VTQSTDDRTPDALAPTPRPDRPPNARELTAHLQYDFGSGEQRGAELDNRLFHLLSAVVNAGSITHAARELGVSYRFLWGSLKKWETLLGAPLVTWSQGRKARPTEFAEKLLWAERRARTRMQPHIEALRSSLARVFSEARDERLQLLAVRASHDLALPVLQQHLAETANLYLDITFRGSVEALRALNDRQCLVAGFHVPALRGAAPVFSRAIKPLLGPKRHKLIACSRRMQGLMVRKEHATLVRTFPDIVRRRLRFVSRQSGSGTRMLQEHLLHEHSLHEEALGAGDHVENTHVAVALCVASGVADAGLGVEAAALEFGLHFVPLVEESYFLACLNPNIEHPAVRGLRAALAGDRWREILAALPGYRPAANAGIVLAVEEALPWWRPARPAVGAVTGARKSGPLRSRPS
jgi:putative molybdopterin biosynthesis protein